MGNYLNFFATQAWITAQGVFNKVGPGLQPNTVFLVGILAQDSIDADPILIASGWEAYKKEVFSSLYDVARQHRYNPKDVMAALQKTLEKEDQDKRLFSFCSRPVSIEDESKKYLVSIVLQFRQDMLSRHYWHTDIYNDVMAHIADSLPVAVIIQYLDWCFEELAKFNSAPIFNRFHSEIIRNAGWLLMMNYARNALGRLGAAGAEFFDTCNLISSLWYEHREGIGRMIVLDAENLHPNIEPTITFSSPVPMHNYKAIRKLLELSSEELCLLSNSENIYSLGRLCGRYDPSTESLVLVKFVKYYTWELWHDQHLIMRVVYGQPQLPRPPIREEEFIGKVQSVFPETDPELIQNLYKLVLKATKQPHGTTIVISNEAETEANRLKYQCTKIDPLPLTPKLIPRVTAIDGAVLIDASAICYAIGVILDGEASPNWGDPSRGARYNSAINYEKAHSKRCFIIVVSEDGLVNLIPESI